MSGLDAALLIGRLTVRRTLRSAWSRRLTIGVAAIPLVYALFDPSRGGGLERWTNVFFISVLMLTVLPPLHLAPAVADEFEERTFTYLWSRPLPRWSLVAGKLFALVPLIAIACAVALVLPFPLVAGDAVGDVGALLRPIGALAVGAAATGMVAMGIGSLVPRYPLPAALCYLLIIDLPMGTIPFSVRNFAVTEHVRRMGGLTGESAGDIVEHAIWALALGAVWLAVAIWRTSATEYPSDR